MAIPNRYRVTVLALAMVLAAGLLAAVLAKPAQADDTICTGVVTGPHDNVIVPPGANCTLSNAQVQGNVKNFGRLDMLSTTTVRGNIDGEPGPNTYTRIFGNGAFIGGDVQIQGQGPFIMGFQAGTEIRGNFSYLGNSGQLVAARSEIGGNLKVEKNTGGGAINLNTIGGNVECKENTPGIVEVGNVIGGADKCPEG